MWFTHYRYTYITNHWNYFQNIRIFSHALFPTISWIFESSFLFYVTMFYSRKLSFSLYTWSLLQLMLYKWVPKARGCSKFSLVNEHILFFWNQSKVVCLYFILEKPLMEYKGYVVELVWSLFLAKDDTKLYNFQRK